MYFNIILLLNTGMAVGKMEPFIIGGDYIDIRQSPHSIFLYVECITTFICGGSVLTNSLVLTAAHCLYECKNSHDNTIVIHFGHASIYHMKSSLVSQFLVHEKYNEKELEYDISLLKTKTSMKLGNIVKRVAIVSKYPTRATKGYVTGWGVINAKMERALNLKYIQQELLNRDTCKNMVELPPGTFCARCKYKGQYPEQGDSGGAFVVYNFIQIGIVSFKNVNYDLIVYSNVTYYYNWIKKNAKRLACTNVY